MIDQDPNALGIGSGPDDGRMPLLEHLTELRKRLIRAVIAIAVGFLIAYGFADQLFAALTWPISSTWPCDASRIGQVSAAKS